MTNEEDDDMKKDVKDILEKQYREVTSLYDMAEELTATVESEFVKNPEAQFALVEPLVTQIADATDILGEAYIAALEYPARKRSLKGKVEAALRKIFMALEEYRTQVGLRSKKTLAALANIADPIVENIFRHAQEILIIFMSLMELSLDRIMHKYQVEEFKRANEKVVSIFLPARG